MFLKLRRLVFTDESTIGSLYVDGLFECYTLEDTTRKKPGTNTSIPMGNYEIVINYSNRFKRAMPLLLNVPGRSGIRIHTGNTSFDTSGCILVGKEKYVNALKGSQIAYNDLFTKLKEASDKEKIFIQILDEGHIP